MRRHARLFAAILLLGVLLAVAELTGLRQHFSIAFLRQVILDNRLSGLAIFALLFSLGNLVQIPGWVFLAAAVLTLGKLSGGMATYVAASISCMVTFVIVRYIGADALRQLTNPLAKRIIVQLDARPIASVVLLRILFQTMPALNVALAMSGIHIRTYAIATLLGLPLPIMLYCLFFDQIGQWLGVR